MKKNRLRNVRRLILYGLLGLLAIILAASITSAVVNRGLPTHSIVTDRLDDLEKSRLAEFYHLQQTLGEKIWPGWGKTEIPLIVYNEEYAFLVKYPDPPPGWIKMPQNERRGTAWEPVPNDSFQGQVYYRQRILDHNKTPESFTVLVGDRWVTSFQTMEYTAISFYKGLQKELPPLVREIAPYKLIFKSLIGDSDAYITILAHESFHSFQAMTNPADFSKAEEVMRLQGTYPWEDPTQQGYWQAELDPLEQAAKEDDIEQVKDLARQFLAQRDERRSITGLTAELIDFERRREWLEGVAKYIELTTGLVTASTPDYQWLAEMDSDPEFNQYRARERFWTLQMDQVSSIFKNEGEIRFYYSGLAQAVVLDKLMPGWKKDVISEGMALEDIIRTALSQP